MAENAFYDIIIPIIECTMCIHAKRVNFPLDGKNRHEKKLGLDCFA